MLVLSIGVGNLLENNASMVDDALGTVSSKVITDTDGKATLPLKSSAKITLLGAYSHAPAYGGNMHGLRPSQVPATLEGSLAEAGFQVNPVMSKAYDEFLKVKENQTKKT